MFYVIIICIYAAMLYFCVYVYLFILFKNNKELLKKSKETCCRRRIYIHTYIHTSIYNIYKTIHIIT